MEQIVEWLNAQQVEGNWIVKSFVVIFLALLINYVLSKFFKHLEKQTAKTQNLWDDALLASVHKPVRYFVLLLGARIVLKILEPQLTDSSIEMVKGVIQVGIISLFSWFAIRFISEAEKNLKDPSYTKEPLDETTVSAVSKLLRLSVIITTVLVIAQSMGYSVSGILAFGGIGGIAVGFAAKDLLANFFGGLMIYMDRPFSVGDWVRSPDRQIEGTIEHIGWRLTCIRTFDKRPLYVPNSMFTSIALENPSRMSHRRIYETIGVRYDDVSKVRAILEATKQMLIDHDEIDTTQTLIVNFNQFGKSSLDFFIYTFTKTTNWIKYHEVKEDVLLKIADIIEANGAEFAFPTQTLHLFDETVPNAEADGDNLPPGLITKNKADYQ
ncbi:MAG: mechanosensitive ion channel family protein [Pseudomonadales bacterium]|nr:mechanosensitive ion channel family protein [Pseudomonadales bacterium]